MLAAPDCADSGGARGGEGLLLARRLPDCAPDCAVPHMYFAARCVERTLRHACARMHACISDKRAPSAHAGSKLGKASGLTVRILNLAHGAVAPMWPLPKAPFPIRQRRLSADRALGLVQGPS